MIKGFVEFIREQGVISLTIGFVLGGAITKVVAALVNDIINPLVGIVLGLAGDLSSAQFKIGSAQILYGDFISKIIDFIIIAIIVYYGIKLSGLEKLDKKKG